LNVNDDLGLAQFFLQPLILPPQLLVLRAKRIVFRLRPAFMGERCFYGGFPFSSPSCQGRGIDPFTTQQFTDIARPCCGICFGKNLLLICRAEIRRFAFGVTSGSDETDIIETAFCPSLIDYFLPALLSN